MEFTPILEALASSFSPAPLIQKKSVPLTIMILSPHPDDECIVGSLALRLALENGAHVVNVAVTLGSKKDRQKARLKELTNACEKLEFELVVLADDWKKKEKELKSLIQKYQPQLILAPHVKDHHPTHIKTGELLKKALTGLKKYDCLVAWTEFWGQMKAPNFMLEVPTEVVKLQMEALEMHVGEVARNPYHLRLPAWMMDNVRRGSEIIAGKGEASPQWPFAVLYHLQKCRKGKILNLKLKDSNFSHADNLSTLF